MTLRPSFEAVIEEREKTLGLGSGSSQQQQQQQHHQEALFKFRDKPFYIWDREEHKREYARTKKVCCFNHILGLPVKLGVTHALYPYQKSVIDSLIQYRRIAVVKPRSAGLTELMLRWAEHIALRDMSLKGWQILIVSAPSQNLSTSFVRRMKAHLEPHFGQNVFDTNQNLLEINDVRIEALASHNLRTLRGRDKVAMILIEESDFWNKKEEDELLPTVLPHVQKSNPYIAMVSTPGRKGSLMERMFTSTVEEDDDAETRQYSDSFHKIKIDFKNVNLYSTEEIHQAMLQPNFRREFGGEWGFDVGSLFSYADIQYAVDLGRKYARVRQPFYPHNIYPDCDVVIGVDTAGGSGSQFAIVGCQIWNGHLHVFAADSYRRPHMDQMVEKIVQLWRDGTNYQGHIYVDGSNPGFIRTLKQTMGHGERVDFEDQIDRLRYRGLAGKNDENLSSYMHAIPVVFSRDGPRLLQVASLYIQRHLVAIHPVFKDLISELQSAKTKQHATHEWGLDKSQYTMDLLDAFRCCMYDMRIDKPKIPVKPLSSYT